MALLLMPFFSFAAKSATYPRLTELSKLRIKYVLGILLSSKSFSINSIESPSNLVRKKMDLPQRILGLVLHFSHENSLNFEWKKRGNHFT